jgi:hypothetical protein
MTAPPVVVLSNEPEVIEVIAREVVVACEVVALSAVKLPRVLDALVRRPPVRVERPVTESVPLMVELPVVSVPSDAVVEKRLVDEETDEKKLVVVPC